MDLLSNVVRRAKAATDLLPAGRIVVPYEGSGNAIYPKGRFKDLAEGGYKKNELVYAGISEIATSVPEAPLRVWDEEGNPLNDHPLRLLMRHPNAFMTEVEMWETTIVHLYLAGNAFWEKVKSRSGRVVELWPLRPDKVSIIPDDESFVAGYLYEVKGKKYPLGVDEVVHFKMPDPLNAYLGMPPLRAAVTSIGTDNEATDFAKVLLQNRAIPGVVITTQEAIDEQLSKRLTAKWKQKFGGNSRGEPAFLQAGMDIKTVGLDMQQLAFPDLRNISETRILAVLGVPPILVGSSTGLQRSTFSNYEEARRSFWQETIFPLLRRLSAKADLQLLSEYEDDSTTNEVRFDTSQVSALQSLENERWNRADKAVTSGWITVNEARQEVTFEAVEGGDSFLRPLNIAAVDATLTSAKADEDEETPVEEEAEQAGAHRHSTKELPENLIANLDRLKGRIELADAWLTRWRLAAQREFRTERQEALSLFDNVAKALTPEQANRLKSAVALLQPRWKARIATQLYPLSRELLQSSAELTATELGLTAASESALDLLAREQAERLGKSLTETSTETINGLLDSTAQEGLSIAEQRAELTLKLRGWDRNRAELVAATETIRGVNEGAKATYVEAGFQRFRWVSLEDACPYCSELHGKEVTLGEPFVGAGQTLAPEGAVPLVASYGAVETPPVHPNFRCVLVPAQ